MREGGRKDVVWKGGREGGRMEKRDERRVSEGGRKEKRLGRGKIGRQNGREGGNRLARGDILREAPRIGRFSGWSWFVERETVLHAMTIFGRCGSRARELHPAPDDRRAGRLPQGRHRAA